MTAARHRTWYKGEKSLFDRDGMPMRAATVLRPFPPREVWPHLLDPAPTSGSVEQSISVSHSAVHFRKVLADQVLPSGNRMSKIIFALK